MIHFTIKKALLLIVWTTTTTFAFSQMSSFDNFKTTRSVGESPAVFKQSFEESVQSNLENITLLDEKNKISYARLTAYQINKVLKTGYVLYGDPMTNFVQKVGNNLLRNVPNLQSKIQFFVLKNNMTNALCTEPGIIFITTGLLAQIENEAQLAYIMSHEIAHYQEQHLQITYKERHVKLDKKKGKIKDTKIETGDSYKDMVLLSKDHEFDADAEALTLYNEAGYSKVEISKVFDVLMYSYLSFDEIPIGDDFFGNPKVYIPSSYFPEKANPIKAFEDYDDTKSSHPNIRKRKEAILQELKRFSNWQDNVRFFDEEEFKYIQNIARFETVRENVILGEYGKALYEIYILEKTFPKNQYLETTKAIVWSYLGQLATSGRSTSLVSNISKTEGNISLIYGFFKKLSKEELALLAMREVEDIYRDFPNVPVIKEVRDVMIRNLAHIKKFKIGQMEEISYYEAIELRDNIDTLITQNDTLNIEGESKYDRIRRIRIKQSSSQSLTELNDENFSRFLLYDLVSDDEFNKIYHEETKKSKNNSTTENLTDKELFKNKEMILMPPYLEAAKRKKYDVEATMKLNEIYQAQVSKQTKKKSLVNIGAELNTAFTTEAYNEISLLSDYYLFLVNLKSDNTAATFIDKDDLTSYLAKHNNPFMLLVIGEANSYSIFNNRLKGKAQYIDIATGDIYVSSNYYVNYRICKASVGGLVHSIFSKF